MFQLTIGQKTPEPFDWIYKLAELVQALSWLAWPVTIIVLAIFFRKTIEQFISRLKSAEGLGFKASVGEQVEDLKTKVDRAVEAEGEEIPPPTMAYDEALPQLLENRVDPVETVIKAWTAIDGELRKSAAPSDGPRSVVGIIRELEGSGVLRSADIEAINALRALRNEIVHHPNETEINQDQAIQYAQSAERMVMKLRLVRRIKRGRQQ